MSVRIHRLAGLVRGLGWGHNTLRRRSDRVEASVIIGAIVLALAAIPVALVLGTRVYHHGLAVSATQAAAERQVTATLLEPTGNLPLGVAPPTLPAQARWEQPPGVRHIGTVSAPEGSAAGSTTRVWTDPAGTLTDPPLTPDQAWTRGAFSVLAAMLLVVALLAAAVTAVRLRLNRGRYAAWADEWRQIGPRWTRHRNSP